MDDGRSTTEGGPSTEVIVVAGNEQADADVDPDRWCALAAAVLAAEGEHGELTLTFVDERSIAELNEEHLGQPGPTDVLSFPLDAGEPSALDQPRLLGDVVICPAVAAVNAPAHAGSFDDELALLVVHGVLHVLGHDHMGSQDTAAMRARELAHLERFHWHGPAPATFSQEHDTPA